MKIYHINFVIYKKHQNVDQSVHNCSEKISYLFKFIQLILIRVGTSIINEWTVQAVYVAMEKSSSYIPTSN